MNLRSLEANALLCRINFPHKSQMEPKTHLVKDPLHTLQFLLQCLLVDEFSLQQGDLLLQWLHPGGDLCK